MKVINYDDLIFIDGIHARKIFRKHPLLVLRLKIIRFFKGKPFKGKSDYSWLETLAVEKMEKTTIRRKAD